MISYSNIEFDYEQQRENFSHEEEPRRKDYSKGRSSRPRRKSPKRGNHPGFGIAGRRHKRVAA